jgi:hypothetical protein
MTEIQYLSFFRNVIPAFGSLRSHVSFSVINIGPFWLYKKKGSCYSYVPCKNDDKWNSRSHLIITRD